MPTIGWPNEATYATAEHLACRIQEYPGETSAAPAPRDSSEVYFNKITQGGRRYLAISALVGGKPQRLVLDRDDIERLTAFLGER